MFDEPEESSSERAINPLDRARDKSDEFRMHAELCAVFEATRKFDAQVHPKLDPEIARDCQKTIAKLEKSKLVDAPIIKPELMDEAARLLKLPETKSLPTNDYHIHRRPGEVMIVRWIEGDEVETFYERLQAHFDAALNQFKEDERQALGWKQDEQTAAYLDALDAINIKMPERYARDAIQKHRIFILSTQAADEIDIMHLCDFIMGAPAADIVGPASAPAEDQPSEQDRAWFFKLFSLRGIVENQERMFFFAFLQKTDEAW